MMGNKEVLKTEILPPLDVSPSPSFSPSSRLVTNPRIRPPRNPTPSTPAPATIPDNFITLQEKLNKLELDSKTHEDSLKRTKVIVDLVKDCKLKYDQVARRVEQIKEFEQEEDTEYFIKKLNAENKNLLELIAKFKSQIKQADNMGVMEKIPLESESDCSKALDILTQRYSDLTKNYELCKREIVDVKDRQSLLKAKKEEGKGWLAKFTGEWNTNQIPLSQYTSHDTFSKYLVTNLNQLPFYQFLSPLTSHSRFRMTQCEIIHNLTHLRSFDDAIDTWQKRMAVNYFQPQVEEDEEEVVQELRKKVLDDLYASPKIVKYYGGNDNGVRIIGGFHGTSLDKALSISSLGFANLNHLDDGWFGNGIYFTTHPEYAALYCVDDKPCLMFCYLILANPYPVVWDDAPSKEMSVLRGKGNYSNHGCHYVPVTYYGNCDFRPPHPEHPNPKVKYDEVVIFQDTHILPHAIIHLENL